MFGFRDRRCLAGNHSRKGAVADYLRNENHVDSGVDQGRNQPNIF
jgi:hypothetical protein